MHIVAKYFFGSKIADAFLGETADKLVPMGGIYYSIDTAKLASREVTHVMFQQYQNSHHCFG